MNFVQKYTTAELKGNNPNLEKDKTVLSNDAYAIGQLLETLINRGLR